MPDLTSAEAARWATRSGIPLDPARHATVAATADYIDSVVAVLRELDLHDTAPAAAYDAGKEPDHAAL